MSVVELHVAESGAGPAVVLLHAFPLHSEMWSAQRAALASDGFRVLTPDLRGFGRSPLGGDEPSLELMAQDVAAVLDSLGLDDVVLGGLSMGGYLAMAFLRADRARVRGLVLADTKAGADPPPAREKRLRIADRLDREGTPDALVDEVLPALYGSTTAGERPEVVAQVESWVRRANPAAAAWAQRAMAARPDSIGTLRAVRVPSLVLLGAEDELATRSDAEAMLDALPTARLEVIGRAGHLAAVEAPAEFTAAVRSFLSDLP